MPMPNFVSAKEAARRLDVFAKDLQHEHGRSVYTWDELPEDVKAKWRDVAKLVGAAGKATRELDFRLAMSTDPADVAEYDRRWAAANDGVAHG